MADATTKRPERYVYVTVVCADCGFRIMQPATHDMTHGVVNAYKEAGTTWAVHPCTNDPKEFLSGSAQLQFRTETETTT